MLNLNGRAYLDACLSSLEAQTYPRDRFEVVLVDNGSTDGSIAFVNEKYPRTRVFALEGNQGFCAPYNAAIRSCETEFVALLNNDARVDSAGSARWSRPPTRHQAVAVASKILDWNGETIDFVGGADVVHRPRMAARLPAARDADVRGTKRCSFRAPDRRSTPGRPSSTPAGSTRIFSRTSRMSTLAGA